MESRLNEVEVRVLGSLIEKQMTTPDYYPLSINALTNACNQKSSRDPVVSYEEKTVMKALDTLRDKHLVWSFKGADSRVIKYGHAFEKPYDLDNPALAVMCVLMLRGPQTPGEIKARAKSLFNFENVEEVEAALNQLISDAQPLALRLPRAPGAKEHRYTHLLCGPIDVEALETAIKANHKESSPSALQEKIAGLESQVQSLRAELDQLKEQFVKFKSQFE